MDEALTQCHRHQAGRFILATNLLGETKWTAELILQEYKAQQALPNQKGKPTAHPTLR